MQHWSRFAILTSLLVVTLGCDNAPPSNLVLRKADRGDLKDIVFVNGTINYADQLEFRSSVSGIVDKIWVSNGDFVDKNQIIMTIRNDSIVDDIYRLNSDISIKLSELKINRIKFSNLQQEYNNKMDLYEKGFISRRQIENAKSDLDENNINFDIINNKLALLRRDMYLADKNLENLKIRAPFYGKILSVNVKRGNYLSKDDGVAYVLIPNSNNYILKYYVPITEIHRVNSLANIRFSINGLDNNSYDAKIDYISEMPIKIGKFSYYELKSNINNTEIAQLREGLEASIEIINQDIVGVDRIPVEAVYYVPRNYEPPLSPRERDLLEKTLGKLDQEQLTIAARGLEAGKLYRRQERLIFVYKGGVTQRRTIKIGGENDEYLEVKAGINPGELVVLGENEGHDLRQK